MNTYQAAEDALLEFCRWQREADKFARWHLELLDAGIEPGEAVQIIGDVAGAQMKEAA